MEQDDKDFRSTHQNNGRVFSGLILLAIGLLILIRKMGAPVPDWLLSWHTLLIIIGLFIGYKSNFRNPGWVIMCVVGGFALVDDLAPGFNLHNYILPVIFITIGIVFLLRPKGNWRKHSQAPNWKGITYDADVKHSSYDPGSPDDGEYIEMNAVFGGAKKLVLSKNFKGGELNSFMGGTEINFLQADIKTPAVLEVNAVFGGAKLIIPSNWDIKNEITAVFGGVEDKRSINSAVPEANKSIILKGTCVFGGIEIKNF